MIVELMIALAIMAVIGNMLITLLPPDVQVVGVIIFVILTITTASVVLHLHKKKRKSKEMEQPFDDMEDEI